MDIISLLNNKNINIMQAWDMKAAWQQVKPEYDANRIAIQSIGPMRKVWPTIANRINAKSTIPEPVAVQKSRGTPKKKTTS